MPTPDLAVARVVGRVKLGGHHIPEDVIRRRYTRGIGNFISPYKDLVDEWSVLDASDNTGLKRIARGNHWGHDIIEAPAIWESISQQRTS